MVNERRDTPPNASHDTTDSFPTSETRAARRPIPDLRTIALRLSALEAVAEHRSASVSSAADAHRAAQSALCIGYLHDAICRLHEIATRENASPILTDYASVAYTDGVTRIERLLGIRPSDVADARAPQPREPAPAASRQFAARMRIEHSPALNEALADARRAVTALDAGLLWLRANLHTLVVTT
jgi:hypothetical protein